MFSRITNTNNNKPLTNIKQFITNTKFYLIFINLKQKRYYLVYII